ncbi:hypothetical protein HZF24_18235 [Sedimentibacter hydroxybenzoicus DSM 7310]|uniref:Uncharacterized protein n=1 Tax=Sedimentibacter hydroxybenzoicus DSM 7310 TaxID=1123245 RepID=A0A974GYC2_SEDHY|nr:hypothetical protein [Sedimentibacter hydroxybenzoicus]NYB76090.1 hypothetical protein [Sedimentibacter hydroxybenzoicus DSM 7310]
MKITITNESGDWKEMLYTKDKVTYEVKSQEIMDFFNQLAESYSNNECMDEMYECLYNLINYGYLYTDSEANVDYFNDEDYDDYDDYDYDENDFISQEGFKLIESTIEYYVDGEKVPKEEYDDAWDDRLGYLGSSNWEENGLSIINSETDEIIFLGKIS